MMDPADKLIVSSQCFPAGLRVLVVDDDPTHLRILQNMLTNCNYQVTTCNLMREALDLLQETNKDEFDIVISDINLRDMDGFKLLDHVASMKMKIPVIMMSVDGETSKVMRGIQHGACDYLLKPIRMEEVQNIWQHVVRKQIHEARDIEGHISHATKQSGNEKKINTKIVADRKSCGDVKKARVVWTIDLHQKFVKAVNQIGLNKVGPKKILELMGVPWLTRENVASHLQKYRLYLRRLQKENELKEASSWVKLSSADPAANVCPQSSSSHNNSITMQQDIVTNEILSMSVPTTHTYASFGDMTHLPKGTTSRISFGPEEVKLESKNEPYSQLEHNQCDHNQLITMPHIQEANITPFYSAIGSFGFSHQELITDVPQQMCEFEYSDDPLECLLIDQGMYIS